MEQDKDRHGRGRILDGIRIRILLARQCNTRRGDRTRSAPCSDTKVDALWGASRYERRARAGHSDHKLRRQLFETAIIERYQRRECSVEEAVIEMYLSGVSARRVEDITEALWGTKISPAMSVKVVGK